MGKKVEKTLKTGAKQAAVPAAPVVVTTTGAIKEPSAASKY
jgi:hypothetical protein